MIDIDTLSIFDLLQTLYVQIRGDQLQSLNIQSNVMIDQVQLDCISNTNLYSESETIEEVDTKLVFYPYKNMLNGQIQCYPEHRWFSSAYDIVRTFTQFKRQDDGSTYKLQNRNLKEMMVAINNILGFPLFNCPKTFFVYLSICTGVRAEIMIELFKVNKLDFVRNCVDAFIPRLRFLDSGDMAWGSYTATFGGDQYCMVDRFPVIQTDTVRGVNDCLQNLYQQSIASAQGKVEKEDKQH